MARIHWRIVAVSSDGRRSTMDEHTAARSPEAVRDWFGQASSACPPFPADRRVGSRAVVSLPGHSGKTVRQPAALAIFGDSLLIIARQIETRQQITVAPNSARGPKRNLVMIETLIEIHPGLPFADGIGRASVGERVVRY